MDVQLPDGTLVQDVPDGITQAELMRRVQGQRTTAQGASAAADVTNPLQAGAIAAGGWMDRMASGVKRGTRDLLGDNVVNAVDALGAKLGMADSSNLEASQKDNKARLKPLEDKFPVSTFIGEAAPSMAAKTPLGMGALGFLEDGDLTERGVRGAAGYAGGKVGQYIGKGVGKLFGPEQAGVGTAANQWGIPTTVGQTTDSKPLQILESVAGNLPGGGAVNAARNRSFSEFNRAVSKTFGEDASALTPDMLGSARSKIGGTIGDIAQRNTMLLDEQLAQEIATKSAAAGNELTADSLKVYQNQLNDLLAHVGEDGTVPGVFYKAMDSKLGRLAKGTQDGNLKNALGDLRASLRDGFDRSVSGADSDLWKTSRRQYHNLMTVADATKTAGDGTLSPTQLLAAVNRAQPNARFGSGTDLAELAQWAKGTLPDKIPNSGTAQRAIYQAALTNPAVSLGFIGGGAYGADKAGLSDYAPALALPFLAAHGMAGKPASEFATRLLERGGQSGAGPLVAAALRRYAQRAGLGSD